jgi:hypothetical protein
VLTEHRGLLNDALAIQHAAIAAPLVAIANQLPRCRHDATVQRLIHDDSVRREVMIACVALSSKGMVEPASHKKAGKRPQKADASFIIHFVKPWCTYPYGGLPTEFDSLELEFSNIEGAIYEHPKFECRAGTELQGPHTPRWAI